VISKENFDKSEAEHGCGYWSVCWEHACPCAVVTENKGYSEEIYNSLKEDADKQVKMEEEDELLDEYNSNLDLYDETDDENIDDPFDFDDVD
jgi:hypothetical protein